ncbi:hypothetical protein OsJ_16895 [Oryza sativa Japonica Group]|uniref:Uncharacterized protein n=1 Tax=Oryza sativa subsp. japonica TaxID=39947 RepID=B9FM59_ORYSJ|nr:hypothetical protein OsJ_16895 [Oryza sativa Japonica Group]
MNVRIESSKIVKPLYDACCGARRRRRPAESRAAQPCSTGSPYDVYMAVIYAFRPPTPPNAALEPGPSPRRLAVYREWAGELADGGDAVLLNDRGGALFVEAPVSAPLAAVMPFGPSPELLRLHPSRRRPRRPGAGARAAQAVFRCGSLVIGFTSHHRVAYGQAAGNFLVAWGLASRRLPVAPHVRERGRPPLARGLAAGEATTLRVSVNGRTRMRPAVPRGYFGNLVLWAFPRCAAGELASRPVQHAAKLIRRAVARADDAYFRSFVDFASSGAVEAEGLAATADESQAVLCPDVEVDSWLGIDFYELDFGGGGGGGGPFYFTPSYLPMEGTVFLVPSFAGDGGIDAYVALFETHLDEFKKICYTY